MTGAWPISVVVAAMSLCVAATQAHAQGGTCWGSYSYPGPVYYYYPRVIAVPDATPSTREPPLSKVDKAETGGERAPVIITTRAAMGDAASAPTGERLKIGFWNLTGRDIKLTVEGNTRTLAKNRALTLELEREFSWQIDRLPAHTERVPNGQTVHEVVLRD